MAIPTAGNHERHWKPAFDDLISGQGGYRLATTPQNLKSTVIQ
jgi:hypothetical protein